MVLMQLVRTPNLFCFFPQKPGFVMPWYICFPTILDLCNLFMKSRALTGKHLFASKPGNYTPWCLTEMSSPGGYTSFRQKHKERQKKIAFSSSQSSKNGQIQGNGQIEQIGIFGRDLQSLWPKSWGAADLNKWIVRFSALLFITNGRACIFWANLCWQSYTKYDMTKRVEMINVLIECLLVFVGGSITWLIL